MPLLDPMLKHELLKELEPEILVRIKKGFDLYKMPSDHKPVRGDHGQCTLPEKQHKQPKKHQITSNNNKEHPKTP